MSATVSRLSRIGVDTRHSAARLSAVAGPGAIGEVQRPAAAAGASPVPANDLGRLTGIGAARPPPPPPPPPPPLAGRQRGGGGSAGNGWTVGCDAAPASALCPGPTIGANGPNSRRRSAVPSPLPDRICSNAPCSGPPPVDHRSLSSVRLTELQCEQFLEVWFEGSKCLVSRLLHRSMT